MKITCLSSIENNPVNKWEYIQQKNDFKIEYSEVFTPFELAKEMVKFIPINNLSTSTCKFLDAGCGNGNITIMLYKILYESLSISNKQEHILKNMLHAIDINSKRLEELKKILPLTNVQNTDFLTYKCQYDYDVIISNPPFIINKETVWDKFLKKCMELLKPNGHLIILIPSIWMKPEHHMFHYLTEYEIKKIKCLKNNEANKLFNGDARTPMSYILVQNTKVQNNMSQYTYIYDNHISDFVKYNITNLPIPMYIPYLINQILPYVKKFGNLEMIKTNCPSTKVEIRSISSEIHKYPNIKTCKLSPNGPTLTIDYSNNPLLYYGKKKVVLANKMYGIPYYDSNGLYGISSRDNYLYINDNDTVCKKIYDYLNCKLIYMIYDSTRYRMCYLEKYAFEFIPNILKANIDNINDVAVYKLFNINSREIELIEKIISKTKISKFKN
jgi:SAM-dependent methyltransferase